MGIWTALTRNSAATRAEHADPRLRGRAYAVPYVDVWEAALATAAATRGWTVAGADTKDGVFRTEARTLLWRFTDDVEVRLSLDADGMTRVDVSSASRVGRADLGANARRIARFLHRLDARLRDPARGGAPRNR